jgi:hypothetical protein
MFLKKQQKMDPPPKDDGIIFAGVEAVSGWALCDGRCDK